MEDEETQIQDASKTVHVKFQLKKESAFGEQFHIVGDDPIFGSWDLWVQWLWTDQMDTHGLSKWIYPLGSQWIYPAGPDRILQTWETNNTVSVSADWKNPELQVLIEEELSSSITNDETLIVLESSNPPSRELSVGEHVVNNGRAVNPKISNPVFHEGDPILVPGLTTAFTTVDAEEISPSEVNKSYAASTSLGVDKAAESNLKKEHGNESSRPKNSTAKIFGDGEELRVNEQAKKQELPNSEPFETVLENNMQWGRRTLHKFLTSFDFLQHRLKSPFYIRSRQKWKICNLLFYCVLGFK